MPIGLMVARKRLTDQWKRGAHGNTFGGNPVCSAAAAATLRVVERDLRANAARVGEYFMTKLRGLMPRYDVIGEVRGRGLMIGMELVEDRASRRPASALSEALIRQAFQERTAPAHLRREHGALHAAARRERGDRGRSSEILDQSLREVLAQPAARSA
jgi:4-aminobutyrate aminotransferase